MPKAPLAAVARRAPYRRMLRAVVSLAMPALLASCAFAPGMRYGRTAPSGDAIDTSAQMKGVRVELRSLTPAVIAEMSAGGQAISNLPEELAAVGSEPYRLGKGDVVTIPVWGHPELSLPLGEFRSDIAAGQMVDDSGMIFYPYIGSVPALGLTAPELREKVLSALSRYITNPQLDIKVTGFRSKRVYVHGAVEKPMSVPITDVPLTLLDAINSSGGIRIQDVTPGDPSRVELTRGGKTYVLDLFGAYGEGRNASQLLLKEGDVIRVPSAQESKVYVLGEIQRPASLAFTTRTKSLTQAIAETGGFEPLSAQSKGVYVMRASSDRVQVWHLDARSPVALAMADRFLLQPGDLVYVDATNLAMWNRVVTLILPTAQLFSQTTQGAAQIKEIVK